MVRLRHRPDTGIALRCRLPGLRATHSHEHGRMEQRFWAKVDASAGLQGCWLWKGAIGTDGAGQFWYRGRSVQARRIAYEWITSIDISSIRLLLTCDNPLCVNPAHLICSNSKSVSYGGAHSRIHSLWGPANQYPCITCNKPASSWSYDGTDPDEQTGHDHAGPRLCWPSTNAILTISRILRT
jgi:hypothetical protein